MPRDLSRALELAVAAAREAGELLRADLHRPGGPRGAGRQGRGRHGSGAADPRTAARRAAGIGLPGRGDRASRRPGRRAALGRGPERRHPRLPARSPRQRRLDRAPRRRDGRASASCSPSRTPTTAATCLPGPRAAGRSRATAGRPRRSRTARSGRHDVVLVSSAGDADPAGQLRVRHARPLPQRAEHRAPPGARGRRRGGRGGLAQLPVRLGLRRRPRAPARGGRAARRRAGPRGRATRPRARAARVCAFGGRRPVVDAPARAAVAHARRRAGATRAARPTCGSCGASCVRHARRLARAQGALLGQVAGDSLGALVEFETAADDRGARPGRAEPARRTAAAGTCWPGSPPTTRSWR